MFDRIPHPSRALAIALAAGATIAASTCAAQASTAQSTPAVVTAPRHVQANSVTFPVSPAADASAPAIASVTVSNDDNGKLTFAIGVPNRPALTPDMDISIFLDTDQNPATGETDLGGVDYVIDLSNNSVDLAKWNGTGLYYLSPSPSSLVYSYANGPTITVDAPDIASGLASFNFFVAAASGIAGTPDNQDWTNAHVDFAPAAGHGMFTYQIKTTPLQISVASLKTSTAKAGGVFTATMAVASTRPDALANGATVTCTAKVAGKSLVATAKGFSGGRATCSWRVPKTAKGKKITGSVAVSAQGLTAQRQFSATVH
jgi:hypothetical protein